MAFQPIARLPKLENGRRAPLDRGSPPLRIPSAKKGLALWGERDWSPLAEGAEEYQP